MNKRGRKRTQRYTESSEEDEAKAGEAAVVSTRKKARKDEVEAEAEVQTEARYR